MMELVLVRFKLNINESDGKQGIQYGALTIPLIKAVQELTERVKELETKNN